MTGPLPRAADPALPSPELLLELRHGEVAVLLEGLRILHLGSPALRLWYGVEAVDHVAAVLVAPSDREQAQYRLAAAGFESAEPSESPVGLWNDPASPVAVPLRLSVEVPEVSVPPLAAFDLLWRHREPARLAHTSTWVPDGATSAVLTLVGAGGGADLVARLSRRDWALAADVARSLGVLSALRDVVTAHGGGRIAAELLSGGEE